MLMLALALQGLIGPAAAQTFDAQGPALPPDGSSVRDPVFGFGAAHPSAPVVTVLGVAASDVLVERFSDGPLAYENPLVDDLFGAQVGALGALSPRIAVGVTLPVWFSSSGLAGGGLAPGDATIWAPIRLLGRSERNRLSVMPFVTVPTGADARYLGEDGVSVGAVASGGVDRGALTAHLDLGLDGAASTGVDDWPGGLYGRFAADVGFVPTEAFGVHLEVRSRAPLFRSLGSVPSELMGSVRFRPDGRVWMTAGAGTAVTRGVGAAGLRMVVGISAALGKADVEPRVIGGPATKEVYVVDERRFPIAGALVTAGGTTVATDHEGYADIPVRAVRDGTLVVHHDGYEEVTLDGVSPDDPWWEVTLRRKPVPVAVSVVGPQGALGLVDVEVTGEGDPGTFEVDEAGVHHWKLGAGTWQITMSSPGYAKQERTIVIEPTRTEPVRVDAVLTSLHDPDTLLRVEVVDALGRPVEDAVVALEDGDLGTTGTGGDLIVHGVEQGEHALVVRSDRHGEATVVEFTVEEGEQTVRATLDWAPGSVRVRVADPVGLPADATVTFVGPAQLPPRSVGADGEELFVLRPGTWEAQISAPGVGAQTRRVEVSDRPGELVTLDVALLTDEDGPAELDLQVVDVDGRPVPDAEITLDGKPVGRTGPGGELSLIGLDVGERTVGVSGDLLVPETRDIEIVHGRQAEDVAISYVGGVTDLRATDEGGAPVDATVTFDGPVPVEPLELGPDGAERVVLQPGAWQVTVSDGDRAQTRQVVVADDERRRREVAVRLAPEAPAPGTLEVRVVDERGEPVDAAVVAVEDAPVGQTGGGALTIEGLPSGERRVVVTKEGMTPAEVTVDLDDETSVEVPMGWAPGAVRVEVAGPDGPVEAEVRVYADDRVEARTAVGGEATIAMAPGRVTVVAEAPGLAPEEVEVELPAKAELTTVPITLAPAHEPATVIRAETPEGLAVADAEVTVGGEVVGRTSGAGTIVLELPETELTVEIRPDDARYAPVELPIRADRREPETHTVVVPHRARPVEVAVVTPGGEAVPADIVAVGPRAVADATAADGSATLELAPGAWSVTARTADGAVAAAEVVIAPMSPRSARSPEAARRVELVVERTQARVEGDRVVPVAPVLFDLDEYALRADALPLLDDLARWLSTNQRAALVEVAGHTDDQGGVAYNQLLSERRALAVKQALIARGVAPERLVARGYGLTRPVTTLTDEASRQRNRRVELTVREWSAAD